jgi:RNA polymerase II subunit A small phosphatase-like protein
VNIQKRLVILDLDETLVYADAAQPDSCDNFDFCIEYDGECSYHVDKRPHLDDLLAYLFANFAVGIWSSAGENYVQKIKDKILTKGQKPLFVWGKERCTPRKPHE